jgi:hypothetical protein
MTIASHQILFGALPLIAIGFGRGELAQLAQLAPTYSHSRTSSYSAT